MAGKAFSDEEYFAMTPERSTRIMVFHRLAYGTEIVTMSFPDEESFVVYLLSDRSFLRDVYDDDKQRAKWRRQIRTLKGEALYTFITQLYLYQPVHHEYLKIVTGDDLAIY